ncbi:hypothetical protein RIR_e43417_A0A2I1GH84_9GLOM [Rhizophagus irregularis DAOM 181602=DAOM 197198]|nr:hypothetical protein RIR_e43417_A0A2I1GH84_9GLOM [Rhizophagus irregularis DAOM 181602=DAOM 197198]
MIFIKSISFSLFFLFDKFLPLIIKFLQTFIHSFQVQICSCFSFFYFSQYYFFLKTIHFFL